MPISYHDMRDDNAFKNAYQTPSHFQRNIFWPHFPSVPSIEQACCLVQQMLGSNYSCNIKKWHFKLKIVVLNRAHVNRIQYKKNNYNRNIPSHCIQLFPQLMENCHAKPKSKKHMHQFVLFGSPSNGVRKTFLFILSLKFQTNFNEKVGMWENTSMFF
jgi:hypothetical protein